MNQPTSAATTRTRNSHRRCSPNVVRKRKAMYQAEPKTASANSSGTPTCSTVFITRQRLSGAGCPSIFSIEIGNDRIRVPVA